MTTLPRANHRFLLRISRARSNACARRDAAGFNDLPSEGISIAESLGLKRFAALIDFPVSHTWQGYYAERGMMPFPPPARVTHNSGPERRSDDFGLGSVDEDRMASLERRMGEQARELRGLRERIARGDTPPRPDRQGRTQSTGVQRVRRTNSGNDTDIQG